MSKASETAPRIKYKGHVLTVDDKLQVVVTGPQFEDGYSFDTKDEAQREIDKRLATQARADQVNLDLKVIERDGSAATITGIHGGTGNLKGVGLLERLKHERYGLRGEDRVYANAPWIAATLKEKEALRQRLTDVEEVLRKVSLDRSRSSFGRPDPASIGRYTQTLVSEHKAAMALAAKGFDGVLAEVKKRRGE
jgi:hypothetical protein